MLHITRKRMLKLVSGPKFRVILFLVQSIQSFKSVSQSVGQPASQPASQSVIQSVSQSDSQSVSQSASQPASQPAISLLSQSASQLVCQSVSQSNRLFTQAFQRHFSISRQGLGIVISEIRTKKYPAFQKRRQNELGPSKQSKQAGGNQRGGEHVNGWAYSVHWVHCVNCLTEHDSQDSELSPFMYFNGFPCSCTKSDSPSRGAA